MLDFPRLRPWLAAVVEEGRAAVLHSETESFRLEGPLAADLAPLLDGQLSADQIAARLGDRHDSATVYYFLIKLENLGWLEDGRARPASPADALWAQLGVGPAADAAPQALRLAALGGLDPAPVLERLNRQEGFRPALADWRAERAGGEAVWLVLTPDYLEPELALFNQRALALGWRWLPCQPLGVEPCFGPLFTPGQTACLECLLHRLRGHRYESKSALHASGRHLGLAAGQCAASLDALLGLLTLELRKELARAPGACLAQGAISLSLKSLGLTRHLLVRRSQCPVCGDPAAWGRLPVEPPALQARPKSGHRDGGERIRSAEQTLAHLLPRVSPLTGEVGLLQDQPAPAGRALGNVVLASWAVLPQARRALAAEPDWRQGRAKPLGASSGKGRTLSQARASALGEALERYCTQHFGYEPVVNATWAEVAGRAIHPQLLNPFSPAQYRDRVELRRRHWTSHVPEPFDEQAAIDWAPAWSLSERRWKLVPAASLYYTYPEERGGRFAKGDSNGVAAGNCLEEAFMQGFFELVERDAVALWWYNRLPRRAMDQDSFADPRLTGARAHMAAAGYRLKVLDLGSDLPVPVLAAAALPVDDPERAPLLGFGCHFDVRIALHRALGEMAQSLGVPESATPLALARDLLGHPLSLLPCLRPSSDAPPRRAAEFANLGGDDFRADMDLAVEMLARRGVETLLADLTRPETGLSVVRVMAPGLLHFWPRLAAERLYRVPVEQGWLERAWREEELNPLPFYF